MVFNMSVNDSGACGEAGKGIVGDLPSGFGRVGIARLGSGPVQGRFDDERRQGRTYFGDRGRGTG